MKIFVIFAILFVTMILDGIIMPGLFGIHESFLVFLFLIALILAYGSQPWAIWSGVVMTFLAELLLGLYPGVLVLSWLVTVVTWQAIIHFFNIKPLIEQHANGISHVFVGMGLMAIVSITMAGISSVGYRAENPFIVIKLATGLPFYWFYMIVGQIAYLFLLARFNDRETKSWLKNTG